MNSVYFVNLEFRRGSEKKNIMVDVCGTKELTNNAVIKLQPKYSTGPLKVEKVELNKTFKYENIK